MSIQGQVFVRTYTERSGRGSAREQREAERVAARPVDMVAHLDGPTLSRAADSVHGRRALSVLSANRNGATLRIHAGSGASDAELLGLVERALAFLRTQGRGVAE